MCHTVLTARSVLQSLDRGVDHLPQKELAAALGCLNTCAELERGGLRCALLANIMQALLLLLIHCSDAPLGYQPPDIPAPEEWIYTQCVVVAELHKYKQLLGASRVHNADLPCADAVCCELTIVFMTRLLTEVQTRLCRQLGNVLWRTCRLAEAIVVFGMGKHLQSMAEQVAIENSRLEHTSESPIQPQEFCRRYAAPRSFLPTPRQ
jgi:hypothetical protein